VAELRAHGRDVRALRRSDADARSPRALGPHIAGASHVYLCLGLPYAATVWERDWPAVMTSVLDACEAAGARLIFLDNTYMYGPPPLASPFGEDHPQQPVSRKGNARKRTADLALAAHREGRVRVVIGRAADFYGPGALNSPFYIRFLQNILAGKAPQTLMPEGPRHTWALTSDLGRALVRLAADDAAYGEAWHLPAGPAVTVADMADLFRRETGRDFRVSFIPPVIARLLGLFNPAVREVNEMSYQFRTDYVIDWSRFRVRYPDVAATPYDAGVRAMVRSFATPN
jgi:nucleoside-diphosphate-sugar epimerase